MAGEKILLAHCPKTGKKFCVAVKKSGSTYEAVNFVDVSDSDYAKLSSEISPVTLDSASNLVACRYCQSRKSCRMFLQQEKTAMQLKREIRFSVRLL